MKEIKTDFQRNILINWHISDDLIITRTSQGVDYIKIITECNPKDEC